MLVKEGGAATRCRRGMTTDRGWPAAAGARSDEHGTRPHGALRGDCDRALGQPGQPGAGRGRARGGENIDMISKLIEADKNTGEQR